MKPIRYSVHPSVAHGRAILLASLDEVDAEVRKCLNVACALGG